MHRLQDAGRTARAATGLTDGLLTRPVRRPFPRHPGSYRGRFAPSPTGALHLGSLLTAVASFLQARAQRGEWVLRIDDIDRERCTRSSADAILRTLERFELHWDGPVVYQSQRIDRYRAALDSLRQAGLVYDCSCPRKVLATKPIYPGTCGQGLRVESGPCAARLRINDSSIRFDDCLHGPQFQDLRTSCGDFIIRRRDGSYAYHLATVIDDADAEVTEVVRGSDLLDSTPRQIYLQRLLRLPTPSYCHTPVVIAADGRKISKQNAAPAIDSLKPSDGLVTVLEMLRQHPPPSLKKAGVSEILKWAVDRWDVSQLGGITDLREP